MKFLLPLLACFFSLTVAQGVESPPKIGEPQILKWKDGKRACFLLAFDDSAPSQLKNVVPELERRKIVGTFYLVTGNSLYASLRARWEEAAKSPFVVVANHTFTHKGIENGDGIEAELAQCNEVLYPLKPGEKKPRLIAFGTPGGVPWIISKADFQAALVRHHLVDRPPFAGPPIHYKTAEATLAVVDQALARGEMGHLDFHGVGGDWLVTPVEWFTALLDKLEAERDRLWITDAASWHKYVKERDGTKVTVVEAGKDRIRLALKSELDPALYDEGLSISAKVPSDWKRCQIVQGAGQSTVPAPEGTVLFTALPGGGEVVLQRAGD